MISIIISSVDKSLLERISENIKRTIGVPYEILSYENSGGKRGICAVYNQGIKEAKYNMLCLMHEDIVINSNDWGHVVLNTFKNNTDLGLLGVVGSTYKSLTPAGWTAVAGGEVYGNFIQSHKYNKKDTFHYYKNPDNKKLAPVVCIDGLWMCVPGDIARKHLFDEHLLTGFHGYDIDFSLSIGKEYKVAVTFDVLLHHFSEGNLNSGWLAETMKVFKKWSPHLPKTIDDLSYEKIVSHERGNFKDLLKTIKRLNAPNVIALKALWMNNRFMQFNFNLFMKLHYYTLLNFFR